MQTQFIEINYWELIKNIAITTWEWFWAFSKMLFDFILTFTKSNWKFILVIILIALFVKAINWFVYRRKL